MRTSLAYLLLVIAASAQAQELGTLFHSPAERQALERLRRGESPEQAAINRAEPVVTGYVKRSDGKSTVFLDKQPFAARDGGMQGLLEPRIIERFEPMPLPVDPTPPAATERAEVAGKAAPPKIAPAARPKVEKDD